MIGRTLTIAFIKRCGSRDGHKEINKHRCVYGIHKILCNTDLNPIQRLKDIHFQRSQTMCYCGEDNLANEVPTELTI